MSEPNFMAVQKVVWSQNSDVHLQQQSPKQQKTMLTEIIGCVEILLSTRHNALISF